MSAISDKYTQLGGAAGFLGAPISGEVPAAGGGAKQEFQGGSIYWHATTGAFEVHGPIQDRWRTIGAEASILGYPMTDEKTGQDGVGRYNHFLSGSIYWTPTTGAHEVYGPIRERWAELGWERGLLRYPSSTPYSEVSNRVTYLVARFQHGRIELNFNTQQVYVAKSPGGKPPNYLIPIIAYRVSDDDGSRPCAITAGEVQQWINEANRVYAAAGVRFTYDGVLRDLRDTEVNNLTGESDPWWQSVCDRLNQLAQQYRSVVVVHRSSIGGGFSHWGYDFVAMSYFDPNALYVLPHELGHHFGLVHTHGRNFATVRAAADYVLSGGTRESFDGDRGFEIADTAPDPYIEEIKGMTSIQAITLGGQAFSLARKNIMSYWDHGGTGQLSHDQIDRVRKFVVERSRRYLKVTIEAAVGGVQSAQPHPHR